MCVLVLLPVVEAELPLLENYLHEGELEAQDVRIRGIAAIKQLRVWLHRVDMTTRYNEARANSPCSDDHKLGTLLDFLLMLENTGVSLKHIIDRVVAENVDALEMHLVKSKKLLRDGQVFVYILTCACHLSCLLLNLVSDVHLKFKGIKTYTGSFISLVFKLKWYLRLPKFHVLPSFLGGPCLVL